MKYQSQDKLSSDELAERVVNMPLNCPIFMGLEWSLMYFVKVYV